MKILNEEMLELVKKLVEFGVDDFDYWPSRNTVEIGFQDDDEQKIRVEIKL